MAILYDSNTVFGSTHIAGQLLFSMLPSLLTFNFDLIFGLFYAFLGLNGLFLALALGFGSQTVLGSSHVDEQL